MKAAVRSLNGRFRAPGAGSPRRKEEGRGEGWTAGEKGGDHPPHMDATLGTPPVPPRPDILPTLSRRGTSDLTEPDIILYIIYLDSGFIFRCRRNHNRSRNRKRLDIQASATVKRRVPTRRSVLQTRNAQRSFAPGGDERPIFAAGSEDARPPSSYSNFFSDSDFNSEAHLYYYSHSYNPFRFSQICYILASTQHSSASLDASSLRRDGRPSVEAEAPFLIRPDNLRRPNISNSVQDRATVTNILNSTNDVAQRCHASCGR